MKCSGARQGAPITDAVRLLGKFITYDGVTARSCSIIVRQINVSRSIENCKNNRNFREIFQSNWEKLKLF